MTTSNLTPRPEWVTTTYITHDTIVDSIGYTTYATSGKLDYQGDALYLLHDDEHDRYGLLVIGYGSCSGCDELEWILSSLDYDLPTMTRKDGNDYAQLVDYRTRLINSIHWENSHRDLIAWALAQPSTGNAWWSHEDNLMDWLRQQAQDGAQP